MEETIDTPLRPRNVFVLASANDMAKLDEETAENLKQALLVVNLYGGRLKHYPIEEASFNYTRNVALAGEKESVGINGLKDARTVNSYIRRAFRQMGLNGTAVNYLFGNKDENSANDNRVLEAVLNKAIGMINPYKITEFPDHEIQRKLDELNNQYAQITEGKIQQLKDIKIFNQFISKSEKPTMLGHIRRILK